MAIDVMLNAKYQLQVALAEKETNLLSIIRFAKNNNKDVRFVDGYKTTQADIAKLNRALKELR